MNFKPWPLILIAPMLTACTPNISSDNYTTMQTGQAAKIVPGVIVKKRLVHVSSSDPSVGTTAGGVAGAIAGSSLGGGRGSALFSIGGAILGGIAGQALEGKLEHQQGFQYIVRTGNKMISVVQGVKPELHVGQKVYVSYGDKTRLQAM